MWNRDKDGKPYMPSDIAMVENHGLMGQLSYLVFSPPTYLFHALTIRSYLEEEEDYEIIEMLGGILPWEPSGCRTGRLSWYKDRSFIVFRLNDPEVEKLGKKAAKFASAYGRRQYDYGLFFVLLFDCIRCWFWQLINEHRIRRIRPDELKLVWNKEFVCTELPKAIWSRVGKRFIHGAGMPAAYVQAFLEGRLILKGINRCLTKN